MSAVLHGRVAGKALLDEVRVLPVAREIPTARMFLRDLARHGRTQDAVLSVPPLPATRPLLHFPETQIAGVGSIAAVAYSLFVEWNSARYSEAVVDKAARQVSWARHQHLLEDVVGLSGVALDDGRDAGGACA